MKLSVHPRHKMHAPTRWMSPKSSTLVFAGTSCHTRPTASRWYGMNCDADAYRNPNLRTQTMIPAYKQKATIRRALILVAL